MDFLIKAKTAEQFSKIEKHVLELQRTGFQPLLNTVVSAIGGSVEAGVFITGDFGELILPKTIKIPKSMKIISVNIGKHEDADGPYYIVDVVLSFIDTNCGFGETRLRMRHSNIEFLIANTQ